MASKHRRQETTMAKREDQPVRWIEIDASGLTLGRLASEITKVLRGKHRPTFTPHADTGDGVVVVNADQVAVTGNKEAQKIYYRHTNWMGGLKKTPYRTMRERHPERIIESAVWGMMPKTKLGRKQIKRLRSIKGTNHKYTAQQPVAINE
jgi:large subunit ribosomal protein L13